MNERWGKLVRQAERKQEFRPFAPDADNAAVGINI